MMNQIKEISKVVGYDVLVCSNDDIIPIENLMENEPRKSSYLTILFVKRIRNH